MQALIYICVGCAGIILGVLGGPTIRVALSADLKKVKDDGERLLSMAAMEYKSTVNELQQAFAAKARESNDAIQRAAVAEASLAALRAALQPSLPFPSVSGAVQPAPTPPQPPTPGGAMAATPVNDDPTATAMPMTPLPTTPPASLA